MRIKQFVIMMMIICGCVSVGCKNKEVQESDKTASESSRLARQEVKRPMRRTRVVPSLRVRVMTASGSVSPQASRSSAG